MFTTRSIQRLITSGLIVLMAVSTWAEAIPETEEYTLMGVLKIGDDLWLNLRFKNGGTYTASSQETRQIQAVSYSVKEGYATVRDPNGRLVKVFLNKPAAPTGLSNRSTSVNAQTDGIPDFNQMTPAEINTFAKQYSSAMTRSTSARKVTTTPTTLMSASAKVSPVVTTSLASDLTKQKRAEQIREIVEQRARSVTTTSTPGNTRKSGGLVTVDTYLPSPKQELEE